MSRIGIPRWQKLPNIRYYVTLSQLSDNDGKGECVVDRDDVSVIRNRAFRSMMIACVDVRRTYRSQVNVLRKCDARTLSILSRYSDFTLNYAFFRTEIKEFLS